MLKSLLKKLANNEQAGSLANKLRQKRFALFLEQIAPLPRPIKIIDIGGTVNYWENMGLASAPWVQITLVNLNKVNSPYPNIISFAGDARNLSQFETASFDVAFSNSVIEHVGSIDDQRSMVDEMRRLAPRLYLQTPNKYFPLEPHFLFPFFQFLPLCVRVWLVMRFSLGWYPRYSNKLEAKEVASSIRLMSKSEVRGLFPDGKIVKEKLGGITKSFVVLEGF
jgi:hypothetical protein